MNLRLKNTILLKLIAFLFFFIFFNAINFKNKNAKSIYITNSSINIDSNLKGISFNNIESNFKDNNYFKEIIYKGKISNIDTLTLKINNQVFQLLANDIKKNFKTINGDTTYSITRGLSIRKSFLPFVNQFINWEGINSFIWRSLTSPIIILLCISFLFSLFYKKPVLHNFNKSNGPTLHYTTLEWTTAIVVFIALFVLLTKDNKYFFLQDDNYIQFSPVITRSLEDFYTNGTWPTYNFYQNAGIPTSGYSIYALTYIVTHIAFVISKYFLNDIHSFCNVFCFLHFLLGYVFLIKLLQSLKIHFLLALVGSLTFVFSGFSIMTTRSWYYVAPSIFFVPFLTYLRIVWHNKFSFKRILIFCLFIALYAYAGNVQFWIYSLCFWLLLEILFHYFKIQKINLKFLLVTIFLSIVLFLPQLLMTLYETKGLVRVGENNLDLFHGINDMIHPFPNNSIIVDDWGAGPLKKYNWVFFKCNFIFGLSTFFLVFYFCFSKTKVPSIFKPLLIVFLCSIFLGSGKYGVIAIPISKLPIFNVFSHPFKLLFFINFFIIIIGAMFINSFQNNRINLIVIFLIIPNVIWQIIQTKSSFHNYSYTSPYEKPKYVNILSPVKDYRILPIGPYRSLHKDYAFSMMHNIATAYQIPSLESLEVLNPKPINIKNDYNDFSVKYIVAYNDLTQSVQKYDPYIRLSALKNYNSFRIIYADSINTIYENEHYTPLVNCYKNSKRIGLTPQIDYATSEVNVQYATKINCDKILLSFNYRQPLKIYLDNKLQPKSKDSLNRIIIFPTFDFKHIKIKYSY